jgi:hypothetical protein
MTEVQKPVPADLLVKGKDKVVVDEPMDADLGTGVEEEDDDLYTRLKTLQRQLEFYEIQVRTSLARMQGTWPMHDTEDISLVLV